jgi:tripartite-type tricarboxylate transporter receptor subunit TctC
MARHLMAAAVLLMAAGIAGAQAEDYPARTVTIIVPFAAGGPADITGRIVADIFNHHLGQKFVVENAGGAGGTVGTLRLCQIQYCFGNVGIVITRLVPGITKSVLRPILRDGHFVTSSG